VRKPELEDVLRRAARRDPEALETLVDLYSPRVYGLLYRLCGSRDAAEELLQETFLRVVRTIDRYEHTGKFEAWLFRIAANLARDRARQGRRRGSMASLDESPVDAELSSPDRMSTDAEPQRRLMQKEACDRLLECLERLTHPEREILYLRHFSGLSFQKIAEILEVPLGTALARAHRALKRLRAEFNESY